MSKSAKHILFLIGALLVASTNLYAQFYDELDDDVLYHKEYVYGLNFNTNAGLLGGVSFKHARVITKQMYHSFSIEMVNVKHPKENRVQNYSTGGSYIEGKQNYLFVVRPQYGREILLFQKAKEQGIQVNWISAIGPTLGIVAPYLIEFKDRNGLVRTEQYNPDIHAGQSDNILGTGRFTEALSQAKIEPGISFKSSLSFEFGTFKTNVTGFEAGFMLDAFANEIVIIPRADNRQVYTSAFLTFFYGFRK